VGAQTKEVPVSIQTLDGESGAGGWSVLDRETPNSLTGACAGSVCGDQSFKARTETVHGETWSCCSATPVRVLRQRASRRCSGISPENTVSHAMVV